MLDLFGEEIQEREKHRDWSENQRGVFSVMDSYYIEDNELHDASLERLLKVGRDGMTRKEKHNLRGVIRTREKCLAKRNSTIRRLYASGFRFVPRYQTRFMINKDGVVWSIYRNKEAKISELPIGYKILVVMFSHPKRKTRTEYIHRLVAETFIPNPDGKETVNHKDGNKANNNVNNLEWATQSENNLHATRILGWKRNTSGLDIFRESQKAFQKEEVVKIRECSSLQHAIEYVHSLGIKCGEDTIKKCYERKSYKDVV